MAHLALLMAALMIQQPGSSQSAATTLDYEYFKVKVQPIFLNKRPGNARCIVCHREGAGGFQLQPLPPDRTSWNEEESRRNFESASHKVVPGDPLNSRICMHPLAEEAGGDPSHGGGKHWTSQDNPEWQILAAWVRGAKL